MQCRSHEYRAGHRAARAGLVRADGHSKPPIPMRSLDPVEASLKRGHLLPRVSVDVYTLYTSLAATLEQSHELRLDPLTPISGRLRAYAQIPNLLGRQVLGAHQPVECSQRH